MSSGSNSALARLNEHSLPALFLLALIFVVGAFFRFHLLGARSLWPAECFSILVARRPWPQFLRTMWWSEGNMGLYHSLLRLLLSQPSIAEKATLKCDGPMAARVSE